MTCSCGQVVHFCGWIHQAHGHDAEHLVANVGHGVAPYNVTWNSTSVYENPPFKGVTGFIGDVTISIEQMLWGRLELSEPPASKNHTKLMEPAPDQADNQF